MKKKIFVFSVMAILAVAAGLYISQNKSDANALSDLTTDNVKALANEDIFACMIVTKLAYNCAVFGDSACPCGSNDW